MRLGVIARADGGGLATMTSELVRALQPEAALLIDLRENGRGPTDPERIAPHCGKMWTADDHGAKYRFPTDADMFFASADVIYCVDEETRVFTRRGWLTCREVREGDETLAIGATDHLARWEPITAVNVFPAGRRRMLSMESRGHSSLTTPDHRWYVQHRYSGRKLQHNRIEPRITTSANLTHASRIPRASPCVTLPTEPKWSDAFVELVAWFYTEGSRPRLRSGEFGRGATITQSHQRNATNCARIRGALTTMLGPPVATLRGTRGRATWRESASDRNSVWRLNAEAGDALLAAAPDKVPSYAFIHELTAAQLRLFVEVSMLADNNGPRAFAQKDARRLDAFEAACLLLGVGIARRTHRVDASDGICSISIYKSGHTHVGEARRKWVEYDGPVWCPTTPSGSWLAQRRGTVYYTGNTAETVYDQRTWLLARANGAPVVLHAMPELLSPQDVATPHLWLPTDWRADVVAAERTRRGAPPARVMPVPIAIDRFLPMRRRRERVETWFAHGGEAFHDRNGLQLVLAACHYVERPAQLIVRGGPWPTHERWQEGRVSVEWRPAVEHYWESIPPEADCMVLPRRFAGLSLPMHEAAAQGMPLIVSNLDPQRAWFPEDVRVPMTHHQVVEMKGGVIPVYDTDPKWVAERMNHLAASPAVVQRESESAAEWADSLAWSRWAPQYREAFEEVAASA